ncbi:hypothetical protein SAMN05216391_11373 [Lachnospiraceae bacterium KHCPX20]|nr:hypothetical protein SAMN05216391_11373 [Lachnospiraceae bacterium KHCPX20]
MINFKKIFSKNIRPFEESTPPTFDHHITGSIKAYYKRRIYSPIFYLLLLLLLAGIFPVRSMISPRHLTSLSSIATAYKSHSSYGKITLKNLYFTGYRQYWLGATRGYYYYTVMNDKVVLVLLDPLTSEQGNPTIKNVTVRARILKDPATRPLVLERLAEDLSWTRQGLTGSVSHYTLSEPDATGLLPRVFVLAYVVTGLFAILSIISYLLYIRYPAYSRQIRRLAPYGNPRKMLKEAEEELSTLPQLATEDMFITQHYFIETSTYGVAIVPIREILWIYKYSTLHKLFWHHFAISYTLCLTCNKHRYLRCPKNTKSNIDGIMDYLAEANHDILVGFSEENRRKVEVIQNDLLPLRKILAFLSRRV